MSAGHGHITAQLYVPPAMLCVCIDDNKRDISIKITRLNTTAFFHFQNIEIPFMCTWNYMYHKTLNSILKYFLFFSLEILSNGRRSSHICNVSPLMCCDVNFKAPKLMLFQGSSKNHLGNFTVHINGFLTIFLKATPAE